MISRRHLFFAAPALAAQPTLKVATFSVDVTPPVGAPLCYSLVVPAEKKEAPLLAKGVVLYPGGAQPVVLCAVDWLGIGGEGHVAWRTALAKACRTTPDRVAVQTVHQHDAPGQDDGAHLILRKVGRGNLLSPQEFCTAAMNRVAQAAGKARPVKVTEMGTGEAKVDRVASNRRILSADGKTFQFQRFTACKNSPLCDEPEGVIDPMLKAVTFYGEKGAIASLHYYATHPMSYYGKGVMNPDFVGIARESVPGFHVYFTAGAGNIGAGKYNDGNPAQRAVLAERIANAMKAATANQVKRSTPRLEWKSVATALPYRDGAEYGEAAILKTLTNLEAPDKDRASAARYLAWHQFSKQGGTIPVSSLRWEGGALLHLPGELFVEYQLGAQKEKPKDWIGLAAYGDYGPMYIGTEKAYSEGGYEVSVVSRVAPTVEGVLRQAMRQIL